MTRCFAQWEEAADVPHLAKDSCVIFQSVSLSLSRLMFSVTLLVRDGLKGLCDV